MVCKQISTDAKQVSAERKQVSTECWACVNQDLVLCVPRVLRTSFVR
jgi:hypothetical protein